MHSIYGWGLTVGGVSFIDARLCITVRLVDASGALRVTWPCFAGTAERGLTALLRRICRLLTRLGDPVVWDCATRHVDTRDLLPFQGTLRCIGVEGSHYRVDLAYTMEFILPETVPSMPTRRYSTHAASPSRIGEGSSSSSPSGSSGTGTGSGSGSSGGGCGCGSGSGIGKTP